MNTNEWLNSPLSQPEKPYYRREDALCADGFHLSIQASASTMCRPRKDNAEYYTNVEVSIPTKRLVNLEKYCVYSQQVYHDVPVEILDKYLQETHGGIVGTYKNFPLTEKE